MMSLYWKILCDPDLLQRRNQQLCKATIDLSDNFMTCGSSFKNKGVQFMLDSSICKYLPSPLDKDDIKGTDPKTDAEVVRKPDVNEPFCCIGI